MILVIDDNKGFARIIERGLVSAGYTVDVVSRGADGIERLADADAAGLPYDLAIIDYRLPDISGVEIGRIARAHGDQTPFVLISGEFPIDATKDSFHGVGGLENFSEIMGKPILRQPLIDLVNRITGHNKSLPPQQTPIIEAAKSLGIEVNQPSTGDIVEG